MNIGNSAISFLQKSQLNVPGDPGTDCEAGGKDLSWLRKFQGLEVSLPQNEFSEERFIHEQGEFYSQKSASAQESKAKAVRHGDAGKKMKFNIIIQKSKILIMSACRRRNTSCISQFNFIENASVILLQKQFQFKY